MLLQPIYQVPQKVAVFVGDLEEEKALQKVWDALSLGPYDPADPMVLEVSVAERDVFGAFGRSL